jgi:FdhD protein
MTARAGALVRVTVRRVRGGEDRLVSDRVVGEEPLEIRLEGPQGQSVLGVTLRTPSHDFELCAGLLLAEGLIRCADDLLGLRYCGRGEQRYNVVTARLRWGPPARTARSPLAGSACGVCGVQTISELASRLVSRPTAALAHTTTTIDPAVLVGLPHRLRQAQPLFARTGGLHAAALFTEAGECLVVREDIGRHNAVDQAIGWALLQDCLDRAAVLLVSGRIGMEIAQKAVVAGIPCLASISAPSSLAISMAQAFGLTVCGFLRGEGFNVYSGPERLRKPDAGVILAGGLPPGS